MPSISNVSFNVRFDLTGAPKIVLTDTTSSAPTGMVGFFTITQPDGYTRTGSVDSPDINAGGVFEYALTPDSIGGPQCGNYTIKFTAAAPGYFSTDFTRTFAFSYSPVSLVLTKNFDIFTPSLSYSDGTNYAVSGYSTGAVTRSWLSTSTPTGNLTSSGITINLAYNGQYYDASYTTTLTSSLTYQNTSYAWLSVSESLTKTEVASACTPKPLDELVQMLESFRNGDIDCSGETPDFDRAQILYTHLIDMLRLLLAGGIGQPGVLKVYEDFLFLVRGNQSIPCTHTNQPIPAYDFSDYEVSPFTADASYCTTFGDGVNLSYLINHKLNDTCVLAQVYEVATGQQVFADLVVVDPDNIYVTLLSVPTTNQYRIVVHVGLKGLQGPAGPGVAEGGTTGQYLAKKSNANYDTEWRTFDNFATIIKEYVKADEAINKGEAVYISGADGTNALIKKASNTQEGTSSKTFGILDQTLAKNGFGYVITEGIITGVNTQSAAAGDPVWLGTNGQLLFGLLNKPYAPAHMVYLGVVLRSNQNNGIIYVKVQNGYELEELHNVSALSPSNNDGIFWNSTTSLWEKKSISTVLGFTPQPAGNYITSLTGEATASGPGAASVTLSNSAVIGKVLTGLNAVAGTVVATDTILEAMGKLQGSVAALVGGVVYKGTWDASTNSPSLTSSVGTKGNYYVVGVAGSTNLNGITDWKIGDWVIFNGSSWEKVDNTDSVVSVNGQTGAVTLTTTNIGEGTNLYYTDARARAAITLTTTGTSGAATYSGGTLNIPQYQAALTNPITGTGLAGQVAYWNGSNSQTGSNNLFWDNTNGRLGIGTNTPTKYFELKIPTGVNTYNDGIVITRGSGTGILVLGNGTSHPSDFVPLIYSKSSVDNAGFYFAASVFSGSSTFPAMEFQAQNSTVTGAIGSGQIVARWANWSTPLMQLFGNGNMILQNGGTFTDAGYRLDVQGTLRSTQTSYFATSSGNVGIGTTSPGSKLTIIDTSAAPLFVRGTDVGQLGAESTMALFGAKSSWNDNDAATIQIGYSDVGSRYIQSTGQWDLYFKSGTSVSRSERMRITGAGNVGIGTTTPSFRLDVNGTISSSGTITATGEFRIGNNTFQRVAKGDASGGFGGGYNSNVNGPNDIRAATGAAASSIYYSPEGSIRFYSELQSANVAIAERMRITLTGAVVIGNGQSNASPAIGLIEATDGSGTNISGAEFRIQGGQSTGTGAGGPVTFYTSPSGTTGTATNAAVERMRVDNIGRVLINTTTAYNSLCRLQVAGLGGNGDIFSYRYNNNTGGPSLILAKSRSETGSLLIAQSGDNLGQVLFQGADGSSFINGASIAAQVDGTPASGGMPGRIVFSTTPSASSTVTERMRIDSAGNVGIGTTSPSDRLTINSTGTNSAQYIYSTTSTEGPQFAIGNNAALGSATVANFVKIWNTGFVGVLFGQNVAGYAGYVSDGASSNGILFGTLTNRPIIIGTNNVERMRIASGGNILMGTTTDSGYRLDVSGTLRSTADAYFATSSGNVGIRTTSIPAWTSGVAALQIQSCSLASNLSLNDIFVQANMFTPDGVVNRYIANDFAGAYGLQDGDHRFYTAPSGTAGTDVTLTERVRITNGGNVGIGTTNPLYKLDVQGTSNTVGIRAASNTANDILYYATGTVTGNINAFTSSINATGVLNLSLENNNTSTGNARFNVQVPSASSGDPFLLLTASGATNWTVGIDNSDSDKLKIGPVDTPSNSGANTIVATTDGKVGIGTMSPAYILDIPYVSNGDYARIGSLIISRDGNGPVLDPADRPLTIRGQGNAGYIYSGTFSTVARWGINTTSVNNNILSIAGATVIGSGFVGTGAPTNGLAVEGSVLVGTTSNGNGTKVFVQNTGTAPSTNVTDSYQLYSADVVAGNAAPHFRTEAGDVIKLYKETTGVGAATFTANSGTSVNDASTFDGYTLAQVVKSLRNQGLLA